MRAQEPTPLRLKTATTTRAAVLGWTVLAAQLPHDGDPTTTFDDNSNAYPPHAARAPLASDSTSIAGTSISSNFPGNIMHNSGGIPGTGSTSCADSSNSVIDVARFVKNYGHPSLSAIAAPPSRSSHDLAPIFQQMMDAMYHKGFTYRDVAAALGKGSTYTAAV